MNDSTSIASLKTLLVFPFRGHNWQGVFLIGSLLMLASFAVPLLPAILVSGYSLGVMRRAIQGDELTLPAWDNWGKLAVDGLRGTVVSLGYMLPSTLAFVLGWGTYMFAAMIMPIAMEAGGGRGAEPSGPLVVLMLAGMGVMMLSMVVGSLLLVLGALPLPMALSHFVAQDKVAAAFRVREWWRLLRKNLMGYVVVWIVLSGLLGVLYYAFMLVYMTMVLCCLIPFLIAPASFYIGLVSAALFGQLYRESQLTLDEPSHS